MKPLLFLFLLLFAASRALAVDPAEFTVGAFTFERPEGWGWISPSSPMRKAQLSVPGEGTAAADVTFFHFGAGQGGSTQANIDRWIAQFQDGYSDTKVESVGKTSVTFVSASGTYLSGMPGTPSTPMPGYALRGAILASPGGDVYVKMTGPENVVKKAGDAFEKMIRDAASR